LTVKKVFFDIVFAKIYAWYLRQRGFYVYIEELSDQFPTGWFWPVDYLVTGIKD